MAQSHPPLLERDALASLNQLRAYDFRGRPSGPSTPRARQLRQAAGEPRRGLMPSTPTLPCAKPWAKSFARPTKTCAGANGSASAVISATLSAALAWIVEPGKRPAKIGSNF